MDAALMSLALLPAYGIARSMSAASAFARRRLCLAADPRPLMYLDVVGHGSENLAYRCSCFDVACSSAPSRRPRGQTTRTCSARSCWPALRGSNSSRSCPGADRRARARGSGERDPAAAVPDRAARVAPRARRLHRRLCRTRTAGAYRRSRRGGPSGSGPLLRRAGQGQPLARPPGETARLPHGRARLRSGCDPVRRRARRRARLAAPWAENAPPRLRQSRSA